MSSRGPSPKLSETDKALLLLLSKILIENVEGISENLDQSQVVLTDEQAEKLCGLLEQLMQEESFFRRLAFVNQIIDTDPLDEKLDLKLVRITGKRPFAAGMGMTSENMRKWRVRLGVAPKKSLHDPVPMTFTHFLKMEEKLLNKMDVNPRVSALALQAASQNEGAFLQLLRAINGDPKNSAHVSSVVRLQHLRRKFIEPLSDPHKRELPKERVVGLFTVISNTSVLFTTRDWGVAGTISTMCGGFSMMI